MRHRFVLQCLSLRLHRSRSSRAAFLEVLPFQFGPAAFWHRVCATRRRLSGPAPSPDRYHEQDQRSADQFKRSKHARLQRCSVHQCHHAASFSGPSGGPGSFKQPVPLPKTTAVRTVAKAVLGGLQPQEVVRTGTDRRPNAATPDLVLQISRLLKGSRAGRPRCRRRT